MSGLNRILNRRKAEQQTINLPENGTAQPINSAPEPQPTNGESYMKALELSQYNPSNISFTASAMPNSSATYNQCLLPTGAFVHPIYPDMDPIERAGQQILRCGSCRGYMCYFNELGRNTFKCFLCGRDNNYLKGYDPNVEEAIQTKYPSYIVNCPKGFYIDQPSPLTFAFLVDINVASAQYNALTYLATIMKQVFSDSQHDNTCIYFYTYDQVVQEYDFTGPEPKSFCLDPTITESLDRHPENRLSQIRQCLFMLLDELPSIAQSNRRQLSNLMGALQYVKHSLSNIPCKLFIVQSNQMLLAEQAFVANPAVGAPGYNAQSKNKNAYTSRNSVFLETFAAEMIKQSLSVSFLSFSKGGKSALCLSDFAKLTNSELLVYEKDNSEEMLRFYYQFFYLLSTPYDQQVKMEVLISAGWQFKSIYVTGYRIREAGLRYQLNYMDPNKRVALLYNPLEGRQPLTYFALQIATTFCRGGHYYMSVSSSIIPVTGSIDLLYQSTDYQILTGLLGRAFISSTRSDDKNLAMTRILTTCSEIWKSSQKHFKKKKQSNYLIENLMLSALGFIKSHLSNLEYVKAPPAIDRIICERLLLQHCGAAQIESTLRPSLFDLTSMDPSCCQAGQSFVYPHGLELKFLSLQSRILLMDAGQYIYLYVAARYPLDLFDDLFGHGMEKSPLTEQNLNTQTFRGRQVETLIQTIRSLKQFQWVPLRIIRAGQKSQAEMSFYLNFYAQKYEEFKFNRQSLPQFLADLEKPALTSLSRAE